MGEDEHLLSNLHFCHHGGLYKTTRPEGHVVYDLISHSAGAAMKREEEEVEFLTAVVS